MPALSYGVILGLFRMIGSPYIDGELSVADGQPARSLERMAFSSPVAAAVRW
jgi:hypothetical protein